jgi:hypothetical protein
MTRISIMKLTTTITAISLCFVSFIGLSQDEIITEVSKNVVSTSITVHTYKLITLEAGVLSSDTEEQEEYSNVINNINETFLDVDGVTRCTFDNATQTFTILTNPNVNLQMVKDQINAK